MIFGLDHYVQTGLLTRAQADVLRAELAARNSTGK